MGSLRPCAAPAHDASLRQAQRTRRDLPLGTEEQQSLRRSDAVSPILGGDPRVVVSPDYLADPKHPGDPGFWDEFETVLDLQARRRSGLPADAEFPLPKIFQGKTMEEAAQAVRADFPTEYPTLLAKQFLGEGAKIDPEILPALTQGEFVNSTVALAEIIGWAVSVVSPSAFASKWSYGRARPEAVAWAIHTGELDAPEHIKQKVADLKLTRAEDFTAYEEGCPKHPAYPAMHSAASSACLFLPVVMNLTPEQAEEARRLDYAVSTSRSLAGVHYETDNMAGLSLAQEVMAKALPDFLAERFGADPEKVKQKITQYRQDWHEHPRPASAHGELERTVRDLRGHRGDGCRSAGAAQHEVAQAGKQRSADVRARRRGAPGRKVRGFTVFWPLFSSGATRDVERHLRRSRLRTLRPRPWT